MTASFRRGIDILKDEGALSLMKKIVKYARQFLYSPNFSRVVKEYDRKKSVDKLVDFAMKGGGGIIAPLQDRKEITDLVGFLSRKHLKIILEIGTASGGTLFLFTRIVSPDAVIISIDLPHGRFGGGYPKWKIPLYKSFATDGQKIHLIRANSHESATLEEVKKILGERKIDFLFIDGDHTYEGTKMDYVLYSPLVSKCGIIGFHDILVHTKESDCNVHDFWNEIKKKFRHREIVNDWEKKMGGIGLLFYK